jgi:hypothetical protein
MKEIINNELTRLFEQDFVLLNTEIFMNTLIEKLLIPVHNILNNYKVINIYWHRTIIEITSQSLGLSKNNQKVEYICYQLPINNNSYTYINNTIVAIINGDKKLNCKNIKHKCIINYLHNSYTINYKNIFLEMM